MYTNIYNFQVFFSFFLKTSLDSLENKIDEIPRKQNRKSEVTFSLPSGSGAGVRTEESPVACLNGTIKKGMWALWRRVSGKSTGNQGCEVPECCRVLGGKRW